MALAAFFAGCSNQHDEWLDNTTTDNSLIAVCAGIGDPSVTTRTTVIGYQYTTPSSEHPLVASVWFTDDPTQFENTGTATTLPRYSNVTFISAGMTFPDSDVLPYTSEKATYAVGFWPRSGWSAANSNTEATHAIDGLTDLMFAPKITAAAGALFTTSTPLEFRHLLTWLHVRVTASNDVAVTSWGKITSITVASENTLNVTLLDKDNYTITCSGSDVFTVYDNPSGVIIPSSSTELGSIFCAPTADAKYTITVVTENGTKSIDVNLKDLNGNAIGSGRSATQGKEFVITLTFQPFNMIDAVGKSLLDWENENVNVTGS